ncbi:MAG: ABC transporter permease [Chloroflexia bacterium]
MLQYIVRRLISLIPTLLGVTIVVFLFLRLIPGDPAVAMLGEHASEENVARIREQLGFNRPLFLDVEALQRGDLAGFFDSQYFRFLGRLLQGDLGNSVHYRRPVADDLKQRFPATVELTVFAMLVAVAVGVPVGIISAAKRNSLLDSVSMIGALVGVSMPIFWLGLMEIMLFAVFLKVLPFGGRLDSSVYLDVRTNFYLIDSIITGNLPALGDTLKHLILPSLALGTIPMAIIARMTRSSMLDVLQQDYIRTARAKGLREQVVLAKHALRNALLPVVTIVGLQTGILLSGAILTETIFAWPGIGKWIYDAIAGRDYPIVQGGTLVIAFVFVMINLLVDISYAFLDPRIHYE